MTSSSGMDEDGLRRLFQDTVGGLAPTDGALDHLRRAVPARRARKRQALVGVAAAALLLGTAIPAFVHVAGTGTSDKDARVNLGRVQDAHGGTGQIPTKGGTAEKSLAERSDGPTTPPDRPKKESRTPQRPDGTTPGTGSGAGGGTGSVPVPPRGNAEPLQTRCDASQLTVALAESGAPGADGSVYGTFRIVNASGDTCTVEDPGTISLQNSGAADPAKLTVLRHTPGGPAAGLPDPSQEAPALLLAPQTSYEVRFAWMPSESCPTTGESPSPTPSEPPVPGEAGGGGGAETSADGMAPQLITESGGTADGSVTVSLVADSAPTAETSIPNACAGTVYQTGLLATSA
ncbi:hypothetical protein [Streptomyces yaizuensis]|uniref:DUF4232 domain-containing protein n=1 Tax=Streptomyces yaizuensis TaxID=2989713 RepID=A0ABQ5P038_9ACTN|nr:hypothetical protein [Streptomyces sp. YSPA8]GLF95955.1 DUF4232 domain-containing protein [Streptomyces sp. YSPA8]